MSAEYVKNLFSDVKRRKEFMLQSTSTISDKEGSQVLYRYRVAVHDSRRKTVAFFTINVLVNSEDTIIAKQIYDEQGKPLEYIDPRIVDMYLLSKSDRPITNRFSNPLLGDSKW